MWWLLFACTRSPAPIPAAVEAAVSVLPPPFSADRIRDGMPVGTTLRFQETGPPVTVTQWEVVAHGPDEVSIRFSPVVDGSVGQGAERGFTWKELESHAHFPPGTTRERTSLEAMGHSFEAWRYTVVAEDESVTRYTFADRLPGPPILVVTTRAGELVSEMRLLERQ